MERRKVSSMFRVCAERVELIEVIGREVQFI